MPDAGPIDGTVPVPRALLHRASGDDLAVPEFRSGADLSICSRLTLDVPALGAHEGWHVRFGRELNATDDRPHFRTDGDGLPVIAGRHLSPFRVDTRSCTFHIPAAVAARRLRADRGFTRPRLAYRDVAAATNRTTLIAAIVPARVVSTHTVFCLKDRLEETAQYYLCGVFNSYVANYLVRMRVGTHVTAGLVSRLPVPRPSPADRRYDEIAALAKGLERGGDGDALARLHGAVAALYGLSRDEFRHVLDTFPLVPQAERDAALEALPHHAGSGPPVPRNFHSS
jgi:hypothetical protein